MTKFNLTGKVNAITLDNAFMWLVMPFKRLNKTKDASIINFIFVSICVTLFNLCCLVSSLSVALLIFFPLVIGSVLLNFHISFHDKSFRSSFYTSFKEPYMIRLLKSAMVFFMVLILLILLLVLIYVQMGLYSDECSKVIKNFLSLLSSVQPNDLFNGDVQYLAEKIGTTPEFLRDIIKKIVILLTIGIGVMAIFVPWVFLSCNFVVFTYEDAKKNKINFYWLAFMSFFKVRNWIPYFMYGFSVYLINAGYGFLESYLRGFSMGNIYMMIIISSFLKAPVIIYVAYSYYFVFIDLFCDTTCKETCSDITNDGNDDEIVKPSHVNV